jgi:hypothetical protein
MDLNDNTMLQAILQADIPTTKHMLESHKDAFKDKDIWKLKFDHEFPNAYYVKAWSSMDNYAMQKYNSAAVIVMPPKLPFVDRLIYPNNPVYERIVNLFADRIDYRKHELVDFVSIGAPMDRFVVIQSTDSEQFKVGGWYGTIEHALTHTNRLLCNEKNIGRTYQAFILDITRMFPYFDGTPNPKSMSRSGCWFHWIE